MKKNENGFSVGLILLIFIITGAIIAAGWFVWDRQNNKSLSQDRSASSNKTTEEVRKTKETLKTMSLQTAPLVSVSYDSSWKRLTEYNYERDGLTKTIDGTAFLIRFQRLSTTSDYMNRSTGGAYPVGEHYKEINADGKKYYIGKITEPSLAAAFLSSCPISKNGACSVSLPDGYGYMLIELYRFTPTKSDYQKTSPLILTNTADMNAIDEFANIMGTLKY